MKSKILYLLLSLSVAVSFTSCLSDDLKNSENGNLSKESLLMPVVRWSIPVDSLLEMHNEEYVLVSSEGNTYIYEYSGMENITLSYMFDQGKLVSSSVMLEDTKENLQRLKNLLSGFKKVGKRNGIQIYANKKEQTAAVLMSGNGVNGKEYMALCFAHYVKSDGKEDDNLEYVDLGLSVKWAKANVGARAPEYFGRFYSWSETSIKNGYWIDNYEFSDNYDNKYVFEYHNPLNNICGTKYDVAKKVMGDEWRMPTREESVELIYGCTWELDTLNDVAGVRAYGPNGNSLFIPDSGHLEQDEGLDGWTHLWVGEATGRTSETAYVISPFNKEYDASLGKGVLTPRLGTEWKIWGMAVRAVREE